MRQIGLAVLLALSISAPFGMTIPQSIMVRADEVIQ
jgi:hypothetical protein